MNHLLLTTSVVLGIGCAHEPPAVTAEPTSATPSAAPAADVPVPTESPREMPVVAAPRLIRAEGHDARVSLTEGSGFLVDGNAPPPPPGSVIARHPAVGGSCIGDPRGCSLAGTAVRSATTFDAVARGLEAAGFTVTIE